MKTFKLKSLTIIQEKNALIEEQPIEFIDGLVIDREDDKNYWLIEVFLTKDYYEFFQGLETANEILIKVKISKDTNEPAYFMTKVLKLTKIIEDFNVLLIGKLIRSQTRDISAWLNELKTAGYHGEHLLSKLKEK